MSESSSILATPTDSGATDQADNSAQTTDAATAQQTDSGQQQDTQQTQQSVVPEKYEFKAPEGITLDAELIGKFEPIAKELGLTQEKAQGLVDLANEMQQKAIAHAQEQWTKELAARQEAIKADKEIGGDKLKASLETANRVIGTILNEAEKTELIGYLGKYGDHPALMKLLVRVGQKMSEGTFVDGKQTQQQPESTAKRWYPNMK